MASQDVEACESNSDNHVGNGTYDESARVSVPCLLEESNGDAKIFESSENRSLHAPERLSNSSMSSIKNVMGF